MNTLAVNVLCDKNQVLAYGDMTNERVKLNDFHLWL